MAQSSSNLWPAAKLSDRESESLADEKIWGSLKQAIASSSGFQRWQTELQDDSQFQDLSLERQVRRYLRETLETLAY